MSEHIKSPEEIKMESIQKTVDRQFLVECQWCKATHSVDKLPDEACDCGKEDWLIVD